MKTIKYSGNKLNYYSSGMTTIESEEFKRIDEIVTGIQKSYEIQFPSGSKWDIMMLLVKVMEEDSL